MTTFKQNFVQIIESTSRKSMHFAHDQNIKYLTEMF